MGVGAERWGEWAGQLPTDWTSRGQDGSRGPLGGGVLTLLLVTQVAQEDEG